MEKKTAYLVSCADHYAHRLRMLADCLRERGYEVTYVTADFDHYTKRFFTCSVPGAVQLSALPYRKNLSLARILSHRRFARDVYFFLANLPRKPDVLGVLLPPNFLGFYAAKFREKYPDVKLIFDIFDLWPETFPLPKGLLAPAFGIWAGLRDKSLPRADAVITECDLFRQKLGLSHARTVYLCADPVKLQPVSLPENRIVLCYIGAINHVIGIAEISALVRRMVFHKPVILHIIGMGERTREFIQSARDAGAEVVFHGPVYDDAAKQEIVRRCHFGLNLMRSTVCVGLTMKSVEYFRQGLPILNNIPADTAELVRTRGVGLNPEEYSAAAVMTMEDHRKLRQNVRATFEALFSTSAVRQQYGALLDALCEDL